MEFSTILKSAVNEAGIINKAYSAFHNYSLGNQMAAAEQCLARGFEISPIASYKAWSEKGRQVKKGEKAIALCMPITGLGEKLNSAGEYEAFNFSRFIWRNNWFLLSQTEGADFVPEVKIASWDKDKALKALNITESTFKHLNGNVQGYAFNKSIAINPLATLPHKTRFHEIAHIVLGHTSENELFSDSELTERNIKEVEAESVAYILCNVLDLAGHAESRDYIQNWLGGAEIAEKSAQKIFSAADKILKAGA